MFNFACITENRLFYYKVTKINSSRNHFRKPPRAYITLLPLPDTQMSSRKKRSQPFRTGCHKNTYNIISSSFGYRASLPAVCQRPFGHEPLADAFGVFQECLHVCRGLVPDAPHEFLDETAILHAKQVLWFGNLH